MNAIAKGSRIIECWMGDQQAVVVLFFIGYLVGCIWRLLGIIKEGKIIDSIFHVSMFFCFRINYYICMIS